MLKSNTCTENRLVIHNASEVDGLKLLSVLNTLGYIEFDVPCNLSSLEEKLYAYASKPSAAVGASSFAISILVSTTFQTFLLIDLIYDVILAFQ